MLSGADNYAPRTEAGCKIGISPVAPLVAVSTIPVISIAANPHVEALCHFDVFCLGRVS